MRIQEFGVAFEVVQNLSVEVASVLDKDADEVLKLPKTNLKQPKLAKV